MIGTANCLLELGAACTALASAITIATAHGPARVFTLAQCTALRKRSAEDSSGIKRSLDPSTTSQLAACDNAYGGDKGVTASNEAAPPPTEPDARSSGNSGAR